MSAIRTCARLGLRIAPMNTIRWVISTAPDFPASRNRTWNVLWAAPDQGIFGRRNSLHAGRGRAAWTTRKLRDPSVVQVDILQPVRHHHRVLVFAFAFHLDSGTAAGLASGSLTQSSMIGTATGALAQLGLADDV